MENNKIITVKECLDIMQTGEVFTFSFVTYDRGRKTGGNYRSMKGQLCLPPNEKIEHRGSERPATELEKTATALAHKNPNHGRWYTRNIVQVVDGHPTSIILKIHPPLIDRFNGLQVVP